MLVDFREVTPQIDHRGAKGHEREALIARGTFSTMFPAPWRSYTEPKCSSPGAGTYVVTAVSPPAWKVSSACISVRPMTSGTMVAVARTLSSKSTLSPPILTSLPSVHGIYRRGNAVEQVDVAAVDLDRIAVGPPDIQNDLKQA
jgi:hypothetical protein